MVAPAGPLHAHKASTSLNSMLATANTTYMPLGNRDSRRSIPLRCGNCGFELSDVDYYSGDKALGKLERNLELYCAKCGKGMAVD